MISPSGSRYGSAGAPVSLSRESHGSRRQEGAPAPAARPRANPPLRGIRKPGLRQGCQRRRDRGLDGLPRRRPRQCRRRNALCNKKKLVNRRPWPSRLELQSAAFKHIEAFYNRRCRHSTPRDAVPQSPTNNSNSPRSTVEINGCNNNNQTTDRCHANQGRSTSERREICAPGDVFFRHGSPGSLFHDPYTDALVGRVLGPHALMRENQRLDGQP